MGLFDFLRELFNPVKGASRAPEPAKARGPVRAATSPAPAGPRPAGLPQIETVDALAGRLGIPAKDLTWLLKKRAKHYHTHEIPKADGRVRKIESPKSRLKKAQRWILREILDRVPSAPAAHGFVKGRSPATNAAAHVAKAVVTKIDLRDFFWQVTLRRARGIFESFGYGRDVARALARLACRDGRLPQGAPTSPALTNLACRKLDRRLEALARKYGAAYTRYADDITISHPTGRAPMNRLLGFAKSILRQEGFQLAPEKTRIVRRGSRQTVTGLTVNAHLSAPRESVRALRALLHEAKTKGAAAANRNGLANFAAHVRGRVEAVRAVDRAKGEKLLAAYRAVAW